MHKKESKNKECKELKEKTNKNGFREGKNKLSGFHEKKNELSGKSQQHQAAALKNKFEKEQISKEAAITPVNMNNEQELIDTAGNDRKEDEENITQEATSTNLKIDDVEIPNKDEKSVILRYKDSDKFLDAVFQFEELKNITVPLDWDSDSDSFLVSVSKEISNEFQNFIKEKVDEIPDTREIDEKIAEVQNARSKSALDKDNSITAMKVGKKEIPQDLKIWLAHPNLSDLESIDTATEENTIT